ncbi:MAG TPA: DUF4149 domain-containing protein [Candidatus Paceibacterota bacterium]|nr:DUF4149 domain-containing protein [Candidatus Paceibacterota bacterium]
MVAAVIGLMRFIGIANAAVWFGAAVFFTVAVGPAFFSTQMLTLFGGSAADPNARYYGGAAAQVVMERYYLLQHWCGAIALLHLAWEGWYFGRSIRRLPLAVVLVLFALGLAGGYGIQPRLQRLHKTMYNVGGDQTAAQMEVARRSFGVWHGLSQAANLVVLIGLGIYLWRVQIVPDQTRFIGPARFHLE